MLGTAPSCEQAPFNEPEWEIWGVGIRHDFIERADRWFEVHPLDKKPEAEAKEWRTLIKGWNDPNARAVRDKCELWMFYPEPDLSPRVVQYPVDHIQQKYGSYFMTSSFGWMLALAIEELTADPDFEHGKHTIGLWGINMDYGTEYAEQRAGVRHFLEVASLAGINIALLATGGVTHEPVAYPWCLYDPLLLQVLWRQEIIERDVKDHKLNYNSAIAHIKQLEMVIEELEKARGKPKKYLDERLSKFSSEDEKLKEKLPKYLEKITWSQGALSDNQWTHRYLKPS